MRTILHNELKCAATFLLVLGVIAQPVANAYVLNRTIASTGGCPKPNRFDTSNPATKKISRRWSTSLNANILTSVQTSPTRENEIEQAILNSFSAWTSVGTSLTQSALEQPLGKTSVQNACTNDQGTNFDGLNTICFNQTSNSFTCGTCTGVLAFARVVTSDILGETLGASGPSVLTGEILDADIQFRPPDQDNDRFATRQALSNNPTAFDIESVLTHELGHFFGFSHSAVLRAMMYPFAPRQGQFTGTRCTPNTVCDSPLADDDRAGLRVLYPNPSDPNIGTISGYILPANLLSLAGIPPHAPGRTVTGIFGTHVVAIDADTGAAVAGTLGGWSCNPANPPIELDGFYEIKGLPVTDASNNPRRYVILVEPLDGPTDSGDISNALFELCRSDVPTPCTLQTEVLPGSTVAVPKINKSFTTKIKPQ